MAVIVSPPDPDTAERLLGEIRYQAEMTRDEYVPTRRDNIGNLVINIFILIGILLASRSFGACMGGLRASAASAGEEADAMITLHLEVTLHKPSFLFALERNPQAQRAFLALGLPVEKSSLRKSAHTSRLRPKILRSDFS